MTDVTKYEKIYPSNEDKLLAFMEMVVEMCDFMLSEPERKYSLSFDQINELKVFAQSFEAPVRNIQQKENELLQAREIFEDKKETDFESISGYFNKIKISKGCTDDFLKRYPIKGKAISKDVDKLKASLKITKVPQGHAVSFSKHGFKKLYINVYAKKEEETEYKLLFTAVKSPYIYTEKFTDGMMIKGVYVLDNIEVGEPSDLKLIML